MILILSEPTDPHALCVMDILRQRGAHAELLDLSNFPREARIELSYGTGQTRTRYRERSGQAIDFGEVRAAWWRRPQPYQFDESLNDHMFAATECEEALTGLWQGMSANWMNHPVADAAGQRKTHQLQLADALGLNAPATMVTNSPASAERFAREQERIIYKPFAGNEANWRETRVFGEEEMRKLPAIRHAPVILQEFIPGVDYRVTIVGDHVFPASLDARGANYPVDFRMNVDGVTMRAETLPEELEDKLRLLMAELGLIYGAIDLRRDERDGAFRFLEINPAGQFLFVEDATGQPISAGVADTLIQLAA